MTDPRFIQPDPLERLLREMERTGEVQVLPDGTRKCVAQKDAEMN